MQSEIIREKFIQFFVERGHQQVTAAPIVSKEDPSLLFTNAGMNPFKEIFLGNQPITNSRIISIQPCLRVAGKHNDIEDVGVDTYHHTFFEMFGNWSFGEYFKKEAIQWAWELLTVVYGLSKDRLYVTLFGGDVGDQLAEDQETLLFWKEHIAEDRILFASKKYNFWEMGDVGPCGPCSEIHIDIRSYEERRKQCGKELVNQGHPQVVEIWNLVFMQYNRLASGKLIELPNKYIDTGIGFERLVMVIAGKKSNYDTDLFVPLIRAIEKISGKTYEETPAIGIAMRVIADHIRAVAFVIADGQTPSNTKRGYVIRRILRRAIRYGYTYFDLHMPFMYRLVATLASQFEKVYPVLKVQQSYIEQVIQEEERAFLKTLVAGLRRLEHIEPQYIKSNNILDGRVAFELYDTHGFPLDLTVLIAKEQGLIVDEEQFNKALEEQQARSKKAAVTKQDDWKIVLADHSPAFVGYDQLDITARVVQYRMVEDQKRKVYQVVLDRTPFYPVGGGQVGDTGYWVDEKGKIAVLSTEKEHGQIIHYVERLPYHLTYPVQAVVDKERRILITNNHSATHILHAVLKKVLGAHVFQKGSLIGANSLRFDFSHPSKLSGEQIGQIEIFVNQKIRDNIPCREQRDVPIAVAKEMGANALFGEKYGTYVRVITFDPQFSMELCGGTHVQATGQLGFFKIIHETAVGAGVRRIEAVTATAAEQFITQQGAVVENIKKLLKEPKDVEKALTKLLEEKIALEKNLLVYQEAHVQSSVMELEKVIMMMDGVNVLIAPVTLPNKATLKTLALQFKKKYKRLFLVVGATIRDKPYITVVLSEDLLQKWSKDANDIVQELAKFIKGNGGGQPFFSTGGGMLSEGLPQALEVAHQVFKEEHGIK